MESDRRDGRRAALLGVGLLVALIVGFALLGTRPHWESRRVEGIEGSRESSRLEVTVAHNRCNGGPRVELDESEAGVVVVRAEQDVRGSCDDIGLETTISADLDAPLAGRRIEVDDHDGQQPATCTIDGAKSDVCT